MNDSLPNSTDLRSKLVIDNSEDFTRQVKAILHDLESLAI